MEKDLELHQSLPEGAGEGNLASPVQKREYGDQRDQTPGTTPDEGEEEPSSKHGERSHPNAINECGSDAGRPRTSNNNGT